ncbi:MAG: adenosine kinase, partial [Saprospiraceae bacterium]
MKKYNVYGVGNALVDLECKVNEQFIIDQQVAKGLMTLVDEETQDLLLQAMEVHNYERKSGGSAANTMIALSQLGGKAFYSCKVANDEFGDFYLRDLSEAGVDTNLDGQSRESGKTGKCLVMVTEDSDRTMNTFLGISSGLSVSELSSLAIQASEYVYVEGYLVATEHGYEAMNKCFSLAEENGVKTSITLSDPSIVQAFRPKFESLIGASVDLLFCNEDEAKAYTGMSSLLEAREALKKDAKRFVITLGKNGAMIFDGETFIDIEPYPVKAVDSNGAGDMFAGAYLYGITHGMGAAASGKLATKA